MEGWEQGAALQTSSLPAAVHPPCTAATASRPAVCRSCLLCLLLSAAWLCAQKNCTTLSPTAREQGVEAGAAHEQVITTHKVHSSIAEQPSSGACGHPPPQPPATHCG